MNQSQAIEKQQKLIKALLEITYDPDNGRCRLCFAHIDFGDAPHEEDCIIGSDYRVTDDQYFLSQKSEKVVFGTFTLDIGCAERI